MIALALDASTYVASVAVWNGRSLLGEGTAPMRGAGTEHLLPAVAAVLGNAGVAPSALGRVICGAGPGSFTSLRIAASVAKGIATGAGCPLYAVPSLALGLGGAERPLTPGRYFVVLDALRGELYGAAYELLADGTIRELRAAYVLLKSDVSGIADDLRAKVIGLGHPLSFVPHARGALRLVMDGEPIRDLASWEPDYGRLAHAQVRWEVTHGRPLPIG